MSDTKLSAADIRKMLTETGLPALIGESAAAIAACLPPKPELPDGVPQNWQEALFTPGVCAIPLWSTDRWRFGAICDGMPITDSRTDRMVMFDSYDEAMTQLRGYYEWKQSHAA